MTASMDMFPQQLRKSGRRELLILAVAIVCYLMGLLLVTEVRGHLETADSSQPSLSSVQGLRLHLPPHSEVEAPNL